VTAVSEKPKITWDDFKLTSNEVGQKELLTKLAAEKIVGKTAWGCGGLAMLDLVSVCDGIENIAIFDVSDRVQGLWEKLQKFIPTLDPNNHHASITRFVEWVEKEYSKNDAIRLLDAIEKGISFLSTPTRLQRIHKIFRANQVTYSNVDLGDPRKFLVFVMDQKKKGPPHFVYISNIARCAAGAIPLNYSNMQVCQRWDDFRRSLSLIPTNALVIDSKGKDEGEWMVDSVMRLHPSEKREDLMPPIQELFEYFLRDNNYPCMTWTLEHGAAHTIPTRGIFEGGTYLTEAATNGKLDAIMALLDNKADANFPAANGCTPLTCAALHDQAEAVELLVSRKADLQAVTPSLKSTALHEASRQGSMKAAKTLIELGALTSAKDSSGLTPLALIQHSKSEIYKKRNTPEYRELQKLLQKKNVETRQPRTFTPSAAAPSSASTSSSRVETKSNNDKADSKGGNS